MENDGIKKRIAEAAARKSANILPDKAVKRLGNAVAFDQLGCAIENAREGSHATIAGDQQR